MKPTSFDIDVGAANTTVIGLHYSADEGVSLGTTVILAHGAGASQLSPFMVGFATGLSQRGADVVTFDFAYMQRGRRAPDPKARLEAAYRCAIDTTRKHIASAATRLVVGGKSMGGRIASQVVATSSDLGIVGLVLLGYPLHPPGRPERRRDAHLASIRAPMLFVQGSRDTFGTEAEMRPVVEACPHAQLHVVAGGDHSLKMRGKDAPAPAQVHRDVQDAIVEWLRTTIL
jgi:hypothetical protein